MGAERSQGNERGESPSRGRLYLVGVPIGHPDDITIRALRILSEVDLVAAKDTRAAQALLARHNIHATLTAYDRKQAEEKVPLLIDRLQQGLSIALVSDCGMPNLYDVGHLLVRGAAERGIEVTVIPGPSAATAALSLSGLDGNRFVFEGSCPTEQRALRSFAERLVGEDATVVLFLVPAQLLPLLKELSLRAGDRALVLASDLTTERERVLRGTAHDLLDRIFAGPERLVLVMEGRGRRLLSGRRRGSARSTPPDAS
ncbi:MAG TPA: SAM-dependent methyltransferase [Nitrospiraceae bacterium]|nr:SAM-dependent methyltransferase [Nitrospiraceae bacterium]